MPQFRMEQIAFGIPSDMRARAVALLSDLGLTDWVHDQVVAEGVVHGVAASNLADLSFNYQMGSERKPLETEILSYEAGPNWLKYRYEAGPHGLNHRAQPVVSHLGMHCTAEELLEFRAVFARHGVRVAQEVRTSHHTNPVIAGKRWYHYVIFETAPFIGVDLKFIVRKDTPPAREDIPKP